MKQILLLSCTVIFILLVCSGCQSLREEQNPQPKKHVPCAEWNIKK